MNAKKFSLVLVLLISILIEASCKTPDKKQGPLTESDLIGSKWVLEQFIYYNPLESYNEEIITVEQGSITLEFQDGLVGGYSGCNAYKAVWEFGEFGQLVTRNPTVQSSKVCSEEIMAIENKYIQLISDFRFAEVDNSLLEVRAVQGTLFFKEK